MGSAALKYDDPCQPFEAPAETEVNPVSGDTRDSGSLFENFVDEIDAWARQALAANGFGDCP